MPSHETRLARYPSIGANLVIVTVKFIAAALSHSSAMLAEGIHSLALGIALRFDRASFLVGFRQFRTQPANG